MIANVDPLLVLLFVCVLCFEEEYFGTPFLWVSLLFGVASLNTTDTAAFFLSALSSLR